MNMKKKIIVVGSSNTDMVISADHFPKPGETIIGSGFYVNGGGKGANQAVAAARLGGDVFLIAKLGTDDNGKHTLSNLRKENIDVSHVTLTTAQPSGVAMITVDATGENTIIVDSGANAMLSETDIYEAEDVFKDAAIVLMQLETPVKTLCAAAELGKKYHALVVLNPAPAFAKGIPQELLKNVDIIIPNETESEIITGVHVHDEQSAAAAARIMKAKGCKEVIITMGSKGSFVSSDIDEKVPAFKVKAIDTTGAGDTFCGALSVALSEGHNLYEAAKFASKAASLSVMRLGAQVSMPYRYEINDEELEIENVNFSLAHE